MPRSPLIIDSVFNRLLVPNAEIIVQFDTVMDTSVVPANSAWNIYIDGIEQEPFFQSWDDSTHLACFITIASDPAILGWIRLLTKDTNLRSAVGAVVRRNQLDVFYP